MRRPPHELEERVLYTHDFLHVAAGPDAGCAYEGFSALRRRDVAHASLRNEFGRQGFVVLSRAVPLDVVERAQRYVSDMWSEWTSQSRCRSDDWRMHYMQRLDGESRLADGHVPVADLVCTSQPIFDVVTTLSGGRRPHRVFYTQVACRTPVPQKSRRGRANRDGGYHIDGEANVLGSRFPDHFSLLVGIALSPILAPGSGNFTVYPGAHLRNWASYADLKRRKALPDDLGLPKEVMLDVGDAVIVHPLLPHRGGRNCSDRTRQLVFFRLQLEGIDYGSPERGERLLCDPFSELPQCRISSSSSETDRNS